MRLPPILIYPGPQSASRQGRVRPLSQNVMSAVRIRSFLQTHGVAALVIALAMAGISFSGAAIHPRFVASSPTLSISVSGNHLVDSQGAVVQLRGADISGTEFVCAQGWDGVYGGQPLDQASTYAAMRSWGINVVRVPLNEDCWLGINGVKATAAGAAYQQAIQTEVSL